MIRIAREVPGIVGLKDASGSLTRMQEGVRRLPDHVVILSGDDSLNLACYSVGGRGCISVASNIVPKLVADVWDAAQAGDYARARELHLSSIALTEALFAETSPQPVKAALNMMGIIGPDLRLPLVAMTGPAREKLRAILAEHGLV